MRSNLDEQSKDMLLIMLQYMKANPSIREDERRPSTAMMCRIPLSAQSSPGKTKSRHKA